MLPRPSWLPLAAVALTMTASGTAIADPLGAHRWKDRVLLVVADRDTDPQLQQQRTIFDAMGREARERDLELVVVTGASAEGATLRRRFSLGPGFHALLIGKDGGAKLTAASPLGSDAIFPLIDAMPMRQEEMRRRS